MEGEQIFATKVEILKSLTNFILKEKQKQRNEVKKEQKRRRRSIKNEKDNEEEIKNTDF